ncbi:MAG: hypothetical protein CGU28_07795 [Candidatus Dactylopiibacterium carminicum]|uniref:Haem-binding uptake Tiki superfamily ChaN domain-containing protein n=2 Tax=Candidatus Dactylopiibacterium carminicum TaxID=857335 RepID=A0A272ESH7_9RHOO|nr:hypothetical protein BGI27_10110 [Candidatus Dactylopiibacterium carminicum]PAS93045.1 MAG: hypothetical protein CGU29_09195 [Candidatus Dactylopiibacterium carminicum]PAS96719.1 MAG: hypothetical protein CGU28_07795 [Candidatus Dactylopiibacterium carminicum]
MEEAVPLTGQRFLLLGEVHDNADGHARRLALLQSLIAAGARPAIAMEQFDREHQAELTQAMQTCADADCVIRRAAPGRQSWHWPYYSPVIELALQYRLPLLAANLSRQDAARIVREGFAAALDAETRQRFGLDASLPQALLQEQAAVIAEGHCHLLPENLLPGMARAQVARDVWMARTLLASPAAQTVLLAGNGHVRHDLGVPCWLGDAASGTLGIGFLEPDTPAAPYDRAETVAARTDRGDPCGALKR